MTAPRWEPPVETTGRESLLLKRLKRTKMLFSFLRLHRHELFDEAFQAELGSMYRDSEAGKVPLPPALLAMAILLQAYTGASDAEAVELTVVDMRWQLVLDRIGQETPAFSQGALQAFRQRMIAHDMDRRLLERTVELARRVGGYDPKKLGQLRIAVDSRPLEGAGRVEDTINLLGHVGRRLLEVAARLIQQDPSKLARDLKADDLLAKSIKGALDIDWSHPQAKHRALNDVLRQVEAAEHWVRVTFGAAANEKPLVDYLEALATIREQDLEPDPSGKGQRVRQGVAKDRRVSVRDPEMRHGRKTKTRTFNGYKSHLAVDLDTTLVLACDVSAANQPEASSLAVLLKDLRDQDIAELHFDRGYVSSPETANIPGTKVICKPWPADQGRKTHENRLHIRLRAQPGPLPRRAGRGLRAGAGPPVSTRRYATAATSVRGARMQLPVRGAACMSCTTSRSSSRCAEPHARPKVALSSASASRSSTALRTMHESRDGRHAMSGSAPTSSTLAVTQRSSTWRSATAWS
jgi:hypothetical protein